MIEKFDNHIKESYETCSWISLYYGNVANLLKTINNPSVYVEIGIAMGFHIETILKEFNELKCYGVDPYIPYDPSDSFNNIGKIEPSLSVQQNFDLFCLSVNDRLSIYDKFNHIRKPSSVAHDMFDDSSIDLIFIDGDHTYDAVKNDCILWWNKLKTGGIMCWDDYYWEGVKKAVDEFCFEKNLNLKSISKINSYSTVYAIRK
jgi:hypothetical protein